MDCDRVRECLVAVAEECASDDERRMVEAHVPLCPACREEADYISNLRESLFAAASAAPDVELQDRVLQRIADESRRRPAPEPEHGIGDALWRILSKRQVRLAAAAFVVIAVAVAGWLALYTPAHSTAFPRQACRRTKPHAGSSRRCSRRP